MRREDPARGNLEGWRRCSSLSRWLLLVESTCRDPSQEKEFNRWYDEVHIPDVLKGGPEFRTCRRYQQISSAHGQKVYVAVVEIETDDINRTLEVHRRNMERVRREGRLTDLVEVISRRLYQLDREL